MQRVGTCVDLSCSCIYVKGDPADLKKQKKTSGVCSGGLQSILGILFLFTAIGSLHTVGLYRSF